LFVLQLGGDIFRRMPLILELELAQGIDVNRPDIARIQPLVILPAAARQLQVQTLFQQRRGDHKNDQQHKRQV
jgi:hypothetical protein